MSDQSKKPSLNAYTVRKFKVGTEEKSAWLKIGVVWKHSNGEGFDVVLEALPLNGRITVRAPLPKDEKDETSQTA